MVVRILETKLFYDLIDHFPLILFRISVQYMINDHLPDPCGSQGVLLLYPFFEGFEGLFVFA